MDLRPDMDLLEDTDLRRGHGFESYTYMYIIKL
jgi:hypothetical protein